MSEIVRYFAYGSNADPERFRSRVGDWSARYVARLPRHRLRFANSVRSEGGGGAVVDVDDAGSVDGVIYEITAGQLAAMDREEFDPSRDTKNTGRRLSRTVLVDGAESPADLYTVEDDGRWHPPSVTYLRHILTGLRDAGHEPAALERVRAAAGRAIERSGD